MVPICAMKAYGGIEISSTHSHTSTGERCMVNLMLLSPWGRSPSYPLNSSLDGPQGQFGLTDMRIPCSCLESSYDSLVVHHTNYINYTENVKYIYKYLPQGVGLHSVGVDEKSACVVHGNSGYVKFGFHLNSVARRKSHSSSSASVRSRNWSSWKNTEYEKYKNVKCTSDIHSCVYKKKSSGCTPKMNTWHNSTCIPRQLYLFADNHDTILCVCGGQRGLFIPSSYKNQHSIKH